MRYEFTWLIETSPEVEKFVARSKADSIWLLYQMKTVHANCCKG